MKMPRNIGPVHFVGIGGAGSDLAQVLGGLVGVVAVELQARHHEPRLVGVADPGEVGELADDANDVLSPPADARVGDAGQSFQTFSLAIPARPVALRRSTTRCASSTSRA